MARSSEDKLERICTGIYRQLYREATPSADFDLLVKTGEAFNPKFFAKYYLPDARTSEIIKLHCKKNKLSRHDASLISRTIILGASPSGAKPKEAVDKKGVFILDEAEEYMSKRKKKEPKEKPKDKNIWNRLLKTPDNDWRCPVCNEDRKHCMGWMVGDSDPNETEASENAGISAPGNLTGDLVLAADSPSNPASEQLLRVPILGNLSESELKTLKNAVDILARELSDEKTLVSVTGKPLSGMSEMVLGYCPTCNQMTNHRSCSSAQCLKCDSFHGGSTPCKNCGQKKERHTELGHCLKFKDKITRYEPKVIK